MKQAAIQSAQVSNNKSSSPTKKTRPPVPQRLFFCEANDHSSIGTLTAVSKARHHVCELRSVLFLGNFLAGRRGQSRWVVQVCAALERLRTTCLKQQARNPNHEIGQHARSLPKQQKRGRNNHGWKVQRVYPGSTR